MKTYSKPIEISGELDKNCPTCGRPRRVLANQRRQDRYWHNFRYWALWCDSCQERISYKVREPDDEYGEPDDWMIERAKESLELRDGQ